jgi:hypothetical protein
MKMDIVTQTRPASAGAAVWELATALFHFAALLRHNLSHLAYLSSGTAKQDGGAGFA